MSLKRVHVIVEGRVQGVFFRAYTRDEAQRLQLSGWVRNVHDGTVEAVIEGEAETVDRMIAWFYQGSPMSLVTDVRVSEEEPSGVETGFEVRY
jgi:acylphosphatase